MAVPTFAPRVLESSSTTGTGSFTLTGAQFGDQSFANGLANGAVVDYFAYDSTGAWEEGQGTLSSSNTVLSRTVYKSSNSNTAVSWTASQNLRVGVTISSNFMNNTVLVSGGALGTPASGVLANCNSLSLTTGVFGVLPVASGGTNASSGSITAFNNITGISAAGFTGTTTFNLVMSGSPTIFTPTITKSDSSTANQATILTFTRTCTSTPANNFGGAILFKLDDNGAADQSAMDFDYLWVNATDASRKARMIWHVYDTASREIFRGEASGSAPMIGFLGAAAVVRAATTGTTTGFTAGAGTAMNSASTSTGGSGSTAYTYGDVVLALKNYGLLTA